MRASTLSCRFLDRCGCRLGVEISFKDMCILAAVLRLTVDAEVSLGRILFIFPLTITQILTNKNTPTCSIIPNKYVDVPKIASAVDRHWQQPHPLAPRTPSAPPAIHSPSYIPLASPHTSPLWSHRSLSARPPRAVAPSSGSVRWRRAENSGPQELNLHTGPLTH